jgi:D-serine deaminase-like pyridoxal phosphate-dependent protein
MNMVASGHATFDQVAAKITCTVVSTAVPGKFVIDAGSKTLTQDRRGKDPQTAGFGHILEYPDARIVRLTEEHGEVDAKDCASRPKLGERVQVIPNHICPCINLQSVVWLKHESAELEPMGVDARGQVW